MQLTGIRQDNVDVAVPFPQALAEFVAWIGELPYTLGSWGGYDLRQFEIECRRHGIPLPEGFRRHLNLKLAFSAWRGEKPCGMKYALRALDIDLAGRHHRGINDARNIARICRRFLPEYLPGGLEA